jgi:hypothetical protein
MAGCCREQGYVPPDKLAVLDLLRAARVEVPDGARIWNGVHGEAWRLVDKHGRELGVKSFHTVKACAKAAALVVLDGYVNAIPHP